MTKRTTINPFNLKVYALGAGDNLEEYKSLKIESYSITTDRLRIRFKPGNTFGTQFIKGSEIIEQKVLNFEHLDRRISILIIDSSENKEKLLRILIDNEIKHIDQKIEKLVAEIIK